MMKNSEIIRMMLSRNGRTSVPSAFVKEASGPSAKPPMASAATTRPHPAAFRPLRSAAETSNSSWLISAGSSKGCLSSFGSTKRFVTQAPVKASTTVEVAMKK